MLKKTLLLVILLCTIGLCRTPSAEDLSKELVTQQAEIIQYEADLSMADKRGDLYESLYDSERFWNNVKDIVILVAIVLK